MFVNRRLISRPFVVLAAAMFLAFLGLGVGCSEDDITGDATAEGVQQGLNSVLADTVEPLYSFLGAIPTIVSGGVPLRAGGVLCPDTGSTCSGGSAACTSDGISLTFDFDQCVVATGDLPFTLDGGLVATPGATPLEPIALDFNALFINASAAFTGTGTVSIGLCAYQANVTTPDPASVIGTLFQCDTDEYPTAQSNLIVSFDDVVINFGFDGSATAYAAANQGGNLIANCTVNLAVNPPTSSCSAP